ncbi:MAG: hypothetical protein ACOCX1_04970, partial [Fimbriimonadaceae bacterium]
MQQHRSLARTAFAAVALGTFSTAFAFSNPFSPDLYGTTNGINDAGFWTGGEIFGVDTSTGDTQVLAAYDDIQGFGDIAINRSGEMYVTYSSNYSFTQFAKVNTSDWSFEWVQTLPEEVNALTFIDDTLYGAAGGGSPDNLYRFDALDGTTAPTAVGPSCYLGSDGDLVYDYGTNKLYNVYTPVNVGYLVEVDPSNGNGVPAAGAGSDFAFGTTAGGETYGWGGLELLDGTLYAASFWDQNLYTRTGFGPA